MIAKAHNCARTKTAKSVPARKANVFRKK